VLSVTKKIKNVLRKKKSQAWQKKGEALLPRRKKCQVSMTSRIRFLHSSAFEAKNIHAAATSYLS
jgi:hypothetical protein